jgi:AcrR family transcriptional regulator
MKRPARSRPTPRPGPDPHAHHLRILRQARSDFFVQGYSRFTMDGLAAELGMSKKTLYVHFAGKDEIIGAVIDDLAAEIRATADALMASRALNLAEKLRAFIEGLMERLAALSPATLRDLMRFAPHLHTRLEEVRRKTLPYVFGRFIEEGQLAGLVRNNIPVGFATEFLLQAVQGMMQPAVLERLRLAPREVIATAINLYFGGLLTPAGRKQYEQLFPR